MGKESSPGQKDIVSAGKLLGRSQGTKMGALKQTKNCSLDRTLVLFFSYVVLQSISSTGSATVLPQTPLTAQLLLHQIDYGDWRAAFIVLK